MTPPPFAHHRRVTPWLAAVVLALATSPASAGSREIARLRAAIQQYEFGEFDRACEGLEPFERGWGVSEREHVDALRYLGACRHILGDYGAAEAAFGALLDRRPAAALDPVVFPPEMVSFFDKVKARRVPPSATEPPPAARAEVPLARPAPPKDATGKSKAVALSPFGAGQFQNGHDAKGSVLLALQTISLGVGVVVLVLFESDKKSGSFLVGGEFDDTAKADTYEAVYLSAFATFGVFWLVGILDAFSNFDETPAVSLVPTVDGNGLGWQF